MKTGSFDLNDLLKEFTPLMHKILQRLNIKQHQSDYEDFFQELQMQLIEIVHKFAENPLASNTNRYKFTAYASRGLYWHCLDLLRRRERLSFQPMENSTIEIIQEKENMTEETLEDDVIMKDFLRQAKTRLSKQDYLLLLYLLAEKYTIKEIAEKLNVSRGTIYKRRKNIQKRLEDMKEDLKS